MGRITANSKCNQIQIKKQKKNISKCTSVLMNTKEVKEEIEKHVNKCLSLNSTYCSVSCLHLRSV